MVCTTPLSVNNGDIVQTTLLLTEITKRISKWMSVLIGKRCISNVYVVQTTQMCLDHKYYYNYIIHDQRVLGKTKTP